jgi:hypothetical protein
MDGDQGKSTIASLLFGFNITLTAELLPALSKDEWPGRKPCYIWRDSNGIYGPIGYRAMVFMNSAGKRPERIIDSNSEYKKKDA